MKAWKVAVTGSYKNNNDTIDYSGITGIIPFCAEHDILSFLTARYVPTWLSESPEYPLRVTRLREVFLESYEEIEVPETQFSYIGKDLREMNYNELQDVATAKFVFAIPSKKGGLEQMRRSAYSAYVKTVLEKEPPKDPFVLSKQPPIYVDKNVRHSELHENGTNEDAIEAENDKPPLTLEDLKKVAKGMGVAVKPNMNREKIQSLIDERLGK